MTFATFATTVLIVASASDAAFDASSCDKSYEFDIREWVVDYARPTAPPRAAPYAIAATNKKAAILVNNSYPGPAIEATEGDLICVTVVNNCLSEAISIHWHGQHMRGFDGLSGQDGKIGTGFPAFDGVYGVTQAGIPAQGGSFTYRWRANKGTHFYHAHMQAMQADKGLKGPIIIHAKNDPHASMYTEDKVVALADEWQDPDVCLKAEGANPGNPVCAEIEKASWNGVYGDGTKAYPWPMVTVEQGKCYRLRFIGMMGQAQNFQIAIAGHNMTIIAMDGADTVPTTVSKFNLHAGERFDVVVCANQKAGNYVMSADYDLADFLEKAPAPNMPKVNSAKFWAFLNYAGHTEMPGKASKKVLGGYDAPKGTGGGKNPAFKSAGPSYDTNLYSNYNIVKNLNPIPQLPKADVQYTLDIGVLGPRFSPGVTPYDTTEQLYMFTSNETWKKPKTPLLHTKGQCGADGVPFLTVEKNQTVEIIINNNVPTAHVLHMHGMRFQVVNVAKFSETWCSTAKFECFFYKQKQAIEAGWCKNAQADDPYHPNDKQLGQEYWGCPYDAATDSTAAMLDNPIQKDMVSVWRRSWTVIRFQAENPGTWLFHCHMEQHIPTGQVMAFNIRPADQPAVPKDVPTEGPCPVWSA